MTGGRLLAARLLRLLARHRRPLACWLLLAPLLSLTLLPADSGQPWLPHQLLSCSRPRLASPTDIDAEITWSTLDFEANATKARRFWNDKLEAQYRKVKTDPVFPLKIMLMPHSGRDDDWWTPLTDVYWTAGRATLDALVRVMPSLPDMTFTWSEVSQLHLWWYGTSEESRQVLADLIRSGRLEVTSGTWVTPEDTTARLHTLVQQLVEGHQWLRQHVGVSPRTGLCSGPPGAGCGGALTYLLSQAGVRQAIVMSAPAAWADFLAARQSVDFLWQQQWGDDRGPEPVLTHVHPAERRSGGEDCGTAGGTLGLCSSTDLCQSLLAAAGYDDLFTGVTVGTVKERAEALVAAAGRAASVTAHNVALVMVSANFHPANTSAWRERHHSLAELSRYISEHDSLAATAEIATPVRYFSAVRQRTEAAAAPLARLSGDLHGSGPLSEPARWRRAARQLETRLRDAELLLVWALGVHQRRPPSDADRLLSRAFWRLADSRRTAALLSRRGATAGGGLTPSLARELAAADTTLTRVNHLLLSALLLDLGRFSSTTEATRHYVSLNSRLEPAPSLASVSVQPGDTHQLVIYNSLPFQRSQVVQFVTRTPNIAVEDPSGLDVPLELSSRSAETFVVRFLASRLAPVSMTTYRVSSTDLGSAADPTLTFDQSESDIGGALTISNARFRLQLTDPPYSWLLVDRRSGDQLPVEVRLVRLRAGSIYPVSCPGQDWSRHVGSVTSEASLRCGRLRLTLRLTHATGALGQAVRLLVESEPAVGDGGDGVSDARSGVFSILTGGRSSLGGTSGAIEGRGDVSVEDSEKGTESGSVLLQLRTPVRSQTGGGGFFTDSGGYQMVRRAPTELPRGLRPAAAQASLQDDRWRLSLLLEQTRSVASPAEGELAVMLGDLTQAVYGELLLTVEQLPRRAAAAADRELFANSPLVSLLSQQLISPASALFSSSGSPVRVRTTPRLLNGPLPCDYELVSLRQLESAEGDRPAAQALLTLGRRRLDCRLWDGRDELGCRLERRLPAFSALLGAERLTPASLTGEEEPGSPPLAGLHEVRLDTDQVRSFVVTLDRELPLVKPQTPVKDRGKGKRPKPPPAGPVGAGGGVQFEVGRSYHLQL